MRHVIGQLGTRKIESSFEFWKLHGVSNGEESWTREDFNHLSPNFCYIWWFFKVSWSRIMYKWIVVKKLFGWSAKSWPSQPNCILKFTFDLQFTFSCNSLVHDPRLGISHTHSWLKSSLFKIFFRSRRQQRFRMTNYNLRRVMNPTVQEPFCPPRPKLPEASILESSYLIDLTRMTNQQVRNMP